MKVVIMQSEHDGQFYPSFVADNGEPWFWAEGYTTKSNAERSVRDFLAEVVQGVTEFEYIDV